MKKVKIILWIIVIGFLGLIMYQNREFFLEKHSLALYLVSNEYYSRELPNAIFFMVFFFSGWLIAYLFGLADRFKSGKTIRKLQQTIRTQQDAIDTMKKDVDALKPKADEAHAHASDPTPNDTESHQAIT